MRVSAWSLASVSACALAVAAASLGAELGPPGDWSRALLLVGLAAILWGLGSVGQPSEARSRFVGWLAVLFPAYVAFQLVPLPLFVLRLLSPERSEVADALRGVVSASGFSPLTIAPPATWFDLSRIAAYAVVFLLIREIAARSARTPWWLIFPVIGWAGVEAVWGIVQHASTAEGVSGSYGNRDHFVGLLEMALPFAALYAMATARGSVAKAVVALCIAGAILTGILFSFSKMGFLSTLGSFFVMGALVLVTRLRGWSRWAALGGLLFALVALFLFLPSDQLVLNFGEATAEASQGRWPIWKDTLHLIAAYPLFGAGLGTYFPALLRYQTASLALAWPQAHNDYLQLLAELGGIGFLIPAVLLAVVGVHAVKVAFRGGTPRLRLLGLACVGGMTAILIHSLADFNLYVPANALVFAWIAGLAAGLPVVGSVKPSESSVPHRRAVRAVALGVGCLLVFYAGGWMIFLRTFRNDPRAEAVFCRVGICDSDAALAARERLRGGDSPAVVPPAQIVQYLRRDPAGAYRWCDLGDSFAKAGHIREARACYARAITLAPGIPYMLYRAAGFQFATGDSQTALRFLARAAQADPSYVQTAFGEYDTRKIATDAVLREGLPPDPAAARAYLGHLIEAGRDADAAETFPWMVRRAYVDDPVARQYVEFLLRQAKPEAAADAWALYAGPRSPGYPEANRIYNGDWERDPSGSPFDWTIDPPKGLKVDFDRQMKYAGARSLRLQFDGTENLGELRIWQSVFLKPGRYRFRAYVRTLDISTDQGMSFHVADAESAARLSFTTEAMLGTRDWTLVEQAFEVGAGKGLVRVSLVRKPSLRFDSLVGGTMWVDQVAIVPEGDTRRN